MSAVLRPNHLFGHNRDHDYYFELRAEWEREFLLWHRHRMVQMRTWVVNQFAGGESSQNHQLCPRPDSRRALIIRFCPLADADLKSAQQSMHLLLARSEQT